jgi:hypothetical protein
LLHVRQALLLPCLAASAVQSYAGTPPVIRLKDMQSNAALRGILRDALVTAVNVQWYGNPPPEFTSKRIMSWRL